MSGELSSPDELMFTQMFNQGVLDIIDGMQMDADGPIVAPAWRDLDLYCDRVASAVGRLCVCIFGEPGDEGLQVAQHLGRALQLTNILRDVREDVCRDRIYLPADWLEEAGVERGMLDCDTASPAFLAVMKRGLVVARGHYEKARELPLMVEEDSRAAVRLMAGVYEEILDRIGQDPATVLRGRVGLTEREKVSLVRKLAPEAAATG